jgi:hypothetical protein
MQIGIATV